MEEWFSQWNPVLTLAIACAGLVMVVLNFIWMKKVRREDQSEKLEQKMTDLVDELDKKIVSLGREVSEIQGRLGLPGRHGQ